jgi:hypothetical protein
MRLENFEIHSSIELQTGNRFWDLHNAADFCGLELISNENAVVMRWSATSSSNPWGPYEQKFSGMVLRFNNLQFLNISARDGDLPLTEDTCVSDILKVDPAVENADPYRRTRRDWTPADFFRLVFRFQTGRVIEIESETVELVPVP